MTKERNEEDRELDRKLDRDNIASIAVERRRLKVTELLYVQGLAIGKIAAATGVCYLTAFNDITKIRDEWKSARVGFIEQAVNEQLEKIDRAEYEANQAWEASKRPAKTTTIIEDSAGRTTTKIERRESPGDPQFLNIVMNCIARRCKLLGLDAPVKSESNVTATVTHYQPPPTRAEVLEQISKSIERLKQPSIN